MRAASSARGRKLVFDLGGVSFCDVGGASIPRRGRGGARRRRAARRRAGAACVALLRPRARRQSAAGAAAARHPADGVRRSSSRRHSADRLPASASSARRRWRSPGCRGGGACCGCPICCAISIRPVCVRCRWCMLLGYLIGLILAFQSAVPMRRFGADIFVANLVAISLLRELGPLLAAVILAGRTGSAFAAEIGTMKVNEEVDALVTMGLDPMTMLVLPRHHRGDAGDAGDDFGAGHRRPARHGDGDARLRLSAGDDRQAGAELGDCRRTCTAACSRRCASASRWLRSAAAPGSAPASARAPSGCRRPRRWSAASSPRSRWMACSP